MTGIDLHSHSTASDGTLTPGQLVERAYRNGARMLALTDHDTLSGIAEARVQARTRGIALVAGVEISVTWAGRTIHVLGLDVDADSPVLTAGLAGLRRERDARAVAIDEALARQGFPGALAGARSLARNPELVSRTHFARHLVAAGAAKDIDDVFQRYLSSGRPGHVEPHWASLEAAVSWILAAGGDAVLAHPGRYGLDEGRMWTLLARFLELGGVGLEICSASHPPGVERRLGDLASRLGLRGSQGSDFHDPDESRVDVGLAGSLPRGIDPVWQHWEVEA